MKELPVTLPGVRLFAPKVHGDARGWFVETWHQSRYAAEGLDVRFVQDNVSFSTRSTLRGLHFQNPGPQGKLVQVLEGVVFDVAVDIRRGSPTFGRWVGVELSGENHQQLYVPEDFAHGFCVTSAHALFAYKCTAPYAPEAEFSLRWNDPELAIAWPVTNPELSARDRDAPCLRDLWDVLPVYGA